MTYSKYAHSIKNPGIKHKIRRKDNRWQYICFGCSTITKSKIAEHWLDVTCKNCLKHLKPMDIDKVLDPVEKMALEIVIKKMREKGEL